jgi:hypothetical protein
MWALSLHGGAPVKLFAPSVFPSVCTHAKNARTNYGNFLKFDTARLYKKYCQAVLHWLIVWQKWAVYMNTVCKSAHITSTLRSTLIGSKVFGRRNCGQERSPHVMSNEFHTTSIQIFVIIKILDIVRTFFRNFILNSGSEHRPTHTATRKIKWPLHCLWTTFTPSEIGVLLFNVGLWRNTISMRNLNKAYISWWLVDRAS